MAHVGIDMLEDAVVAINIGVGDPDSPDLLVPVSSSFLAAGLHSWDIDVTDHHAYLPPSAGDLRWWVKVEAEGLGLLNTWNLSWNGTQYDSDDLGLFSSADTAVYYLPRPPSPMLITQQTSPGNVSPGNEVEITLTIENQGLATVGATDATLVSLDPNVVVDSGAIDLGDAWGPGTATELVYTVSFLDTKADSLPAAFEVLIQDEVEQFSLGFDVAVPWPVLSVTGVVVENDDNSDGVLSEGETAQLEVQLTNSGLLNTFGSLDCTLSQSGGTAVVDVLSPLGSIPRLNAGETDDEDDFVVQVTTGAPGEDVEFSLQCADGVNVYDTGFVIEMGQLPWVFLNPLGDPAGDAVNDYGFDFTGGMYRSDGVTLEILLTSATEYNGATLFIEAWGESPGGDYDFYQLVSQSGALTLRGLDGVFGTFTKISEPTVTEIDDYSILISIDIADMGLLLDTMNMGFASGFCGMGVYYCDHFPNGWGDPYQAGLVTDLWYEMSW